jgi:hypothetical protein
MDGPGEVLLFFASRFRHDGFTFFAGVGLVLMVCASAGFSLRREALLREERWRVGLYTRFGEGWVVHMAGREGVYMAERVFTALGRRKGVLSLLSPRRDANYPRLGRASGAFLEIRMARPLLLGPSAIVASCREGS